MEPEEVDIDQEDSELESSVTVHRKKSRIKKIREKWNALFFIPIDVINKKSNRSRDGLQAYKELVCKACSYVFHNRANIKVHTEKYHRNASSQAQTSFTSNRNNQSRSQRSRTSYQKPKHNVVDIVDLDDDDDSSDIEVLDDKNDSRGSNLLNKDSLELMQLAKTSHFQPQVFLLSDLTRIIKNQNNEISVPVHNTSERILRSKKSNNSLPVANSPTSIQSENAKSNKKRDLPSNEKSQINWRNVIFGQKKNEKPKRALVADSSPVKKKPFKPVSLLEKFNKSAENGNDSVDSGIEISDTSFNPFASESFSLSPITLTESPKRSRIRVRDFAKMTDNDASIQEVPEQEMEDNDIVEIASYDGVNNSTRKMFQDIASSPSLQPAPKKKKILETSSIDISIMSVDGEDIIDDSDDVIQMSPHAQIDTFMNQLQTFSKKLTSTPKNTVEIVDLV